MSALEMSHDKALYKSTDTVLYGYYYYYLHTKWYLDLWAIAQCQTWQSHTYWHAV